MPDEGHLSISYLEYDPHYEVGIVGGDYWSIAEFLPSACIVSQEFA